jgi:hypothetical protein
MVGLGTICAKQEPTRMWPMVSFLRERVRYSGCDREFDRRHFRCGARRPANGRLTDPVLFRAVVDKSLKRDCLATKPANGFPLVTIVGHQN